MIMRKIFTSLALVLCIEVLIYLFFAFCNWDLCWIPEVSAFTRFVYAFIAFFGIVSAIGFVYTEMEE